MLLFSTPQSISSLQKKQKPNPVFSRDFPRILNLVIYRVIGITLTLFFPQFNTPGYQFFFYSVFDIFWFVLSRYFRFVLYQVCYKNLYYANRDFPATSIPRINVYTSMLVPSNPWLARKSRFIVNLWQRLNSPPLWVVFSSLWFWSFFSPNGSTRSKRRRDWMLLFMNICLLPSKFKSTFVQRVVDCSFLGLERKILSFNPSFALYGSIPSLLSL